MTILTAPQSAQVREALQLEPHYYCEDSWYTCPASPEGCSKPDAGNDCDCGADRRNALRTAALALLVPAPVSEDAAEFQDAIYRIGLTKCATPDCPVCKNNRERGSALIAAHDASLIERVNTGLGVGLHGEKAGEDAMKIARTDPVAHRIAKVIQYGLVDRDAALVERCVEAVEALYVPHDYKHAVISAIRAEGGTR